jgi:predicted Zn-dependent peptidase
MFHIAFKAEPVGTGETAIRQEIVADLAAEALFGESSALYLKLYEEGLIDSSFGGGFETIDGMAMLLCSGDSDDAEGVRTAVLEQAAKIARDGIPEADFLRMKRSAFGRRIRDLDSFSSTCFRLCAYTLSDYDYFHFPELYRSIESRELQEFLGRVVTEDRCAMSLITPAKEAD